MVVPANVISGELHSLDISRAVMPLNGAFYDNDALLVEGTVNGTDFLELEVGVDFMFSPVFTREMARAGIGVYSYAVIIGDWSSIRITYEHLGGVEHTDNDLLTQIALADFDHRDLSRWLLVTGSESYNPRSRNPVLAKTSEIEVMDSGLQRIEESIVKLAATSSHTATNQQVTGLEVRQTSLEGDMLDLSGRWAYLETMLRVGGAENGGFVYLEESRLSSHVVTHNLANVYVDVTAWALDDTLTFSRVDIANITMVDANTVRVDLVHPTAALIIVRDVTVDRGGFIYESTTAEVDHTVTHMLDTQWPSCCLWVEDTEGHWRFALAPITMHDKDTVSVNMLEPRRIRLVLQRPLPNAFIYTSGSAQYNHNISHGMFTPYIGVTAWVQNADGVTYSNAITSGKIVSANAITIGLLEPRNIKVVAQPASIFNPDCELSCEQSSVALTEEIADLHSRIDELVLTGGGGTALPTFSYDSADGPGEMLVHDITHNLDNLYVEIVTWVQADDGLYYDDAVTTAVLDKDSVKIVLTETRNIRATITSLI